jgi:primase-polymerase (primpol)-like protein
LYWLRIGESHARYLKNMSKRIIDESEAIPETLRERDQWVCWREAERDGKPTKIPVAPGAGGFASSTDPDT